MDFFWEHHIVLTIVINAGIMPPHKKRKIVSTKRSAFWPCGSCRQNCKSSSICCDACRRWHHASCEGLNNYLCALTRLRQVNIMGQCIPWTKSLGPLILGPVQVIFSWTKWGVFLGPLPVGPANDYRLNHAFCL